jgi:hypothetical protein
VNIESIHEEAGTFVCTPAYIGIVKFCKTYLPSVERLRGMKATGRAFTCDTGGSNSKPPDKGTPWPDSVEK